MKMAYISNSVIPSRQANSVHVMKMCQALAQEGNDVSLLAGNSISQSERGINDKFGYYGVEQNFSIESIDLPHLPSPLPGILYSLNARSRINRIKPDLVYGRDTLGCLFSAKSGYDVIFECHAPPPNKGKEFFFLALLKHDRLKAIVVISEALKQILCNAYGDFINKKAIIVAHDGVDIERFMSGPSKAEARKKLSIDTTQTVIGYTGHLYKGRGFNIILEMARKSPNQLYIIIGGTVDNIKECREEAEQNRVFNIVFYGHKPNGELLEYWRSCDLLLMPYQRQVSVSSNKGNTADYMSPLKMFEYMATGVPFISSDLPVLSEVLQNQYNCLMVDPDDSEQWIDAKDRLLGDHALYERLSRNQVADAHKYSWRNRVKHILSIIQKEADL